MIKPGCSVILIIIGFLLVLFVMAALYIEVGDEAAMIFIILFTAIYFLLVTRIEKKKRKNFGRFVMDKSSEKKLKKQREKHILKLIDKMEDKISEAEIELNTAKENKKTEIKQNITDFKKQKKDFQDIIEDLQNKIKKLERE